MPCRAMEGEGEWNARKHGGSKRRIWRKIHIAIVEETLEVRAIEVTSSNIGDAPMLPELLNQIPRDQDIGSVTADGAYDSRKCHEAIAARDAHAVIPPRKNATPWKPPLVHAGMPRRAMDERRSNCPQRCRQCATILGSHLVATVERISPPKPRRNNPLIVCKQTTAGRRMHCIKLLGQSLMARDFERQVAEIQIRIAVLNRYTALGIPITEPVG